MASTPQIKLKFTDDGCADCGLREVQLPEPLPTIGDDFDWLVRDYNGFRLSMLEELAARFAERRRWTPADMEVVIVEALSVVLDQLSDMLDRVHAEAFLESAKQPASVRRLLAMVGYDAVRLADRTAHLPDIEFTASETNSAKLTRLKRFRATLLQYQHNYQEDIDALSPLGFAAINLFLSDPDAIFAQDNATLITNQLNAIQDFFETHPDFIALAQVNELEKYWAMHPEVMHAARLAGPPAIHTQKRAVTEQDYAHRLEEHPLVLRAHAFNRWTGSWMSIYIATILPGNISLEDTLTEELVGGPEALSLLQQEIDAFSRQYDLDDVAWSAEPTARTILRPYVDAIRMSGQETFLHAAEPVGINITLSVRIASNYYQSEVRRNVLDVLGTGLNGFFTPGRLIFGQDLHSSDLIELVMALDGVEAVCLNRFKRVGKRYADQSDSGRIEINGLEVAVCENNSQHPERGMLRITIHGGRRG